MERHCREIYLLADIYNRLAENPDYVPVPAVNGGRSLAAIGSRLGFRSDGESFGIVGERRQFKQLGQWRCRLLAQTPVKPSISWRLDPEQVNAIFVYGCRHRARSVTCCSRPSTSRFANAASLGRLAVTGHDQHRSQALSTRCEDGIEQPRWQCRHLHRTGLGILDEVVEQIQHQMKAQRKYLDWR
jgi:hypothetical protein